LETADQLKPTLRETSVKPATPLPSAELRKNDRMILDFGSHYVGYLSLTLSSAGSHPDAPAYLKLRFCEHEKEIYSDTDSYQGWISKGWIQEEYIHVDELPEKIRLKRRYAFRYVVLEVLDVSEKYRLIVEKAEVTAVTAADLSAIRPVGKSPLEEKLDQVSIRTLANCMQDVFEDGPKRDRRLWLGDLRLQAIANYETFQNFELVKRCLYLFAGTSDQEGRLPACVFTKPENVGDDVYMFDYSVLFAPILLDYYKASGDRAAAEELLPTALCQFEAVQDQFDENGCIKDSDKTGWCFVDWNLELNKQAPAQAIYIYCEKATLELMELLDDRQNNMEAERERLAKDIHDKETAAMAKFYDREQGLFVSGAKKQVSYASQVWFALAGVLPNQQMKYAFQRLESRKDAVRMVTPYLYHHYVEALLKIGNSEKAYQIMCQYWGGMLELGADTFFELYNPENPDESPYGSPVVNSYCHAWSCTPSYFLRKYFVNE
jgi:hypothetical protein